eukprot:TRINITY_DN2901_c0_g1_i5.p1 TRINITY_DN2901_c0_g1~~TRINITY_DN2901_c0_g1_i5.p1  ORF type:complete len:356 (-),score=44.91 TRINITY_DN2901_c0_g1_i5:867-1934(-)
MGWLSKIFKGGSSHKISEGQYHGKLGADMIWNDPSHYSDDLSEKEREDISHAIARSISDEEQKKANGSGSSSNADLEDDEQLARALQEDNGSHLEEDEQLARALQESLNTNPIPYESGRNYQPYENGHNYQPLPLPFLTSFRICAGCNTEIGHGRFLSCMGAVWHPECFRCHACNLPISDYEFSMSGNHPYHKSCYKGIYHPKCDVCKQFIPTNISGLIEYRAHPFWEQKYCPSHESDGTPRCCSCERMEPRDTQYISLGDGRKLCLECLDSSIMDTTECQPLYLDIQDFYEGLNMKVVQQVPLLLVERQALNEALEGEKNGNHHMPETRGLCLSEEQIVRSVRVLRKCNSEKVK